MRKRLQVSGLVYLTLVSLVTAAPVLAAGTCPADFDGDGVVGSADLAQLLGNWGTADPRTDLNGNGYVGDADLNTLLDNWGTCPTCPADLNGDGVVDASDRSLLLAAFGTDCSANLGRFNDVGDYDLEILLVSWSASADPDADPRADLNGDGTVNTLDLSQLLGQFGTDCRPDLNSDGDVDTDDLWKLLGCWGTCP